MADTRTAGDAYRDAAGLIRKFAKNDLPYATLSSLSRELLGLAEKIEARADANWKKKERERQMAEFNAVMDR